MSAYGQCVTGSPTVDACRGGVRITGSTLPPGVSLDLSFMTPGSLDPRITFTRASTATYTDASGNTQTAAVNAPRWDYDPATHALKGLLIEEARTNLALQSGNIATAAWLVAGSAVGAPTVTGNQTTAPDGTATAARVDLPAVSGASAFSIVYQNVTLPAGIATVSFYLRGNVGGERVYITLAGWGSAPAILTTQWQRFVFITASLPTATFGVGMGVDLRDAGQSATPAQTIYAWGAQVEEGAFPTSYIPTTAAAVTRAFDGMAMPFTPTASGTYQAEFIPSGVAASLPVIISGNAGSPVMSIGADSRLVASIKGGASVFSGVVPAMTFNGVNKTAFGYLTGGSKAAVNGSLLGANAVALTVTGTSMEFGSDGVTPGNNALNGTLRHIGNWPRVLSDAEMQQVTT